MGRAGRPNNQHPALRELEEEGLPQGWSEYWQGGRGDIAIDPLAPNASAEDLQAIEEGQIGIQDLFSLFSENIPERPDPDDPVLRALWEREWDSLQELLLRGGADDVLHKLQANQDKLRSLWQERFMQSLHAAFRNNFAGSIELSLLASIMSEKYRLQVGLSENDIDNVMGSMANLSKADSEQFQDLVNRTLLPAYREVFSRDAVERLSSPNGEALSAQILECVTSSEALRQIKANADLFESGKTLEMYQLSRGSFFSHMIRNIAWDDSKPISSLDEAQTASSRSLIDAIDSIPLWQREYLEGTEFFKKLKEAGITDQRDFIRSAFGRFLLLSRSQQDRILNEMSKFWQGEKELIKTFVGINQLMHEYEQQ